jgi:hypothetical protein
VDSALEILLDLAVTLLVMGTVVLTTSWALLHRVKPRMVVLSAALTAAFLSSAISFLPWWESHPNGISRLTQLFDSNQFEVEWKTYLESLGAVGFDTGKIATVKDFYLKVFYLAWPAWEALWCLVWGLLAYYGLSSILSKVFPRVPKPIAFQDWVLPEPLIFGLIIGAILNLYTRTFSALGILGDNLLVFFVVLYTFTGSSILSFFFNKWRVPNMLRFIGYLFFWITYSACCLGVLDVWFDIRKIKTTHTEGAS